MGKASALSEVENEAAEIAALAAAVAEARADLRGVPHEEMRAWLLRIEAGEFDAPPPEPRQGGESPSMRRITLR